MRIHIIGQPRSGTTYIFNVVRQYHANQQDIDFGNEPFNSHLRNSSKFRSHLTNIVDTSTCVIKNHTTHLDYMKQHNLYNEFCKAMDYTLCIVRKNLFDLTLSMCGSINKDQWYKYNQNPIEIETELFEHFYSGFYWNTVKLKDGVYGNFDQIIYYENLIRTPRLDWSNLNICNTDPMALINFKSQTSISPAKEKMVSNYNELLDFCFQLQNSSKYDGGLIIKDNILQDIV